MATNTAAWITAAKAYLFEVKLVPFPLTYPVILGGDVAGEVVSIGANVTRFKVAFTILQINIASEIPDNITYESIVVIPLCYLTTAAGLFQELFLNLIGSNIIQLAITAGYKVISTASLKNFAYVKKLSASQVFNYSSPIVHADLLDTFEGKTITRALDYIGRPTWEICLDVIDKTPGNKFVATTKRGFPDPPEGDNEVRKAGGIFMPAPEPLITGKGLESMQGGVDLTKRGVSAKKVVVSL
ncbi:hypothetical protein V8E51_007729 [Hyaloscypha variabilis]